MKSLIVSLLALGSLCATGGGHSRSRRQQTQTGSRNGSSCASVGNYHGVRRPHSRSGSDVSTSSSSSSAGSNQGATFILPLPVDPRYGTAPYVIHTPHIPSVFVQPPGGVFVTGAPIQPFVQFHATNPDGSPNYFYAHNTDLQYILR